MKRNISMMIKPSSSKCNLKCKYCFYNSIADAREIKDYGFMKESTIEKILDRAFEYCNGGTCSIAFQGGEPLLIGINFFKNLINYIKINNNGTNFTFALQTNGTLINDEWAKFFNENKFLIGVSLDGTKDLHNLNRVDYLSNYSFNKVMKGINILKENNVDNRILYGSTPVANEDMNEEEIQLTREGVVRQFHQDDCSYKVIIANAFAVAESISLHKACHNAIYMERSFNCAHFLQSKDRIHRYGLSPDIQTNYYYLISQDSIDETISDRLQIKESRMLEIIESMPIPLFDNVTNEGDEDIKAIITDYVKRKARKSY